jgi:hypothetical protein
VYYSQGDEDRFFGCIYALPEYVEIKWDGSALQLTLRKPVSGKSFNELRGLFLRYGVPISSLQPMFQVLRKRTRLRNHLTDELWAEMVSKDDQRRGMNLSLI